MKIKNLSLGLCLATALIGLSLESCSKKKAGYTVKVSVTDIGTAKVYRDTLKGGSGAGQKTGVGSIKDSLISKLDSNTNGAKITSVKVTYIDEKGKKIEDKSDELTVDKSFEKTYQVAAGKTIIVTAQAEGTAVGDTTGAADKSKLADLAKKYQDTLKVPGKPAEVTLPTLSITIEKDGETIAAQSVTASKNSIAPKDLTTAGKKTTVSATATAVAFEVK